MNQGYSGSVLRREGDIVVKISSDETFMESAQRQNDLIALSRRLRVLPRIHRIDPPALYMDFIAGHEGFTLANAARAGEALRLLHAQRDYPHPCMTGVGWLIDMALEHRAQTSAGYPIPADMEAEYPSDALILSEPQFIEKPDGAIVFIDFEGMGMGSGYQDLAHVYFRLIDAGLPEVLERFLGGYQHGRDPVDARRVKKLAGVVALAYAQFAEPARRVKLGLHLLHDVGA